MQEATQFLLDFPELRERERPTLENFVTGENAEVLGVLREIREGRGPKFLYLYGPRGAGLTHLLNAIDPEAKRTPVSIPAFSPAVKLYTVDDVEALDAGFARELLALQNAVYASDARLVCAGRLPAFRLPLPQAVRSRLAWGLTYAVKPLSDAAQIEAIARQARLLGADLTGDIREWMSTHLPRDMRSLSRVLDLANQMALREKREITLPIVRTAAAALGLH